MYILLIGQFLFLFIINMDNKCLELRKSISGILDEIPGFNCKQGSSYCLRWKSFWPTFPSQLGKKKNRKEKEMKRKSCKTKKRVRPSSTTSFKGEVQWRTNTYWSFLENFTLNHMQDPLFLDQDPSHTNWRIYSLKNLYHKRLHQYYFYN